MKTEKLFDKLFHPKADGHISKPETIAFAESYHKQKVESITDEMINKRFAVFHIKGKTSDNRKKRAGAKWFKQKLLKQ